MTAVIARDLDFSSEKFNQFLNKRSSSLRLICY